MLSRIPGSVCSRKMLIIFGIALIYILFAATISLAVGPTRIYHNVYINENEIRPDPGFYELEGTILGSVRDVGEAVVTCVAWDAVTQEASFSKDDHLLVMKLNSLNYTYDGVQQTLAVSPIEINSRVYVPAKVIIEAFGGTLRVDDGLIRPNVNKVTSTDTTVTGVLNKPGSVINIKVAGNLIGTGMVDENGSFSISIPPQNPGTTLEVTAADARTTSSARTVRVENPNPQYANCRIYINNEELQSDAGFYESQGIVLGPVRELGEAMNLGVTWEAVNRQITFSSGSDVLVMKLDSTDYTFNGVMHSLAVPPMTANGRTLVPLQVIVEAFGGILRVDMGPFPPNVNAVTSTDTVVTGSRNKPESQINIKVAGNLIGTGIVDKNGFFSINIPPQNPGTTLEVTAVDGGITSSAKTVIVENPPPICKLQDIY